MGTSLHDIAAVATDDEWIDVERAVLLGQRQVAAALTLEIMQNRALADLRHSRALRALYPESRQTWFLAFVALHIGRCRWPKR